MAVNRYISLSLTVLAILCMSCERGFEELNKDPNSPTAISADRLFAQAQVKYHTDYFNGVYTEIWGISTWMQIQANINGITSIGDRYFINGEGLDITWQLMYADVLGNVNEAIRLTADDPDKQNEHQIYRIYRAYIFHRLTDLFGDIPYFSAHNVINEENEPDFTPSYDDQRSIYIDLIEECRSAADALDPDVNSLGGQDWIYNGHPEYWARFANSLALRLSVRMYAKEPTIAQSHISALIEENRLISDNMESAAFPHDNALRSPFYELHNTQQGMYNPAAFMVDLLDAQDDPRLPLFADFTPQSTIFGTFEHVGIPSFMLSSQIDPDEWNSFLTSYVGPPFLEATDQRPLFSHAETLFLLAECAYNGWGGTSTAEEYMQDAIEAHMLQLGIDQVEIDDYLSAHGPLTGGLEQIITEKWKTFIYTDAIEAYSEWRRTGFPILTDENGEPVDVAAIPVRMAYPISELSLNPESVQAVGEGINDFFTPVWWDE